MKDKIDNRSFLRFYISIIKNYKWWYFLILMGPLGSAIHPVVYNYSIKLLVDSVSRGSLDFFSFKNPIFFFLYSEIYIQISWRIHNFASWRSIPHMYQLVADKVFGYIIGHSYKFFQENLSGSIISQVRSINEGVFRMHSAIESNSISIIKVIIFAISLAMTNKYIGLIIVLFVCIKIPLFIKFNKKIIKIEEDCQKDWHNIFGIMADNITNIFNLFAFATKSREKKKIWKYYDDIHKPRRFLWHKTGFIWSIILSSLDISLLIAVCFCIIHLLKSKKMDLGQVAFFITSLNVFLTTLWKAFNDSKEFVQKYAQVKESFKVMQMPQIFYEEPTNSKELKISEGKIEFREVDFSYEENLVFEKLSFKIKKGEKIGIVGSSGVGKSTLISLLMKSFIPNSGKILIDDLDIKNISPESIMKNIIYIPQDVILFHRSIEENICYAKENYTKEDLLYATQNSMLEDFIKTLPEGYQTLVGERGMKLSGGQRQRVSIARAFLKDAHILILDEATSALDSLTEKEVQNSMWELMKNKTCIVIAHRLSTLIDMDKIFVLEDGKIMQSGKHDELISVEGVYKNLWDNQNGFSS